MKTYMSKINIRWLKVDTLTADSLLAEAQGMNLHNIKVAALNKLDIAVAETDKPLQAWIKAMCRENGYPEALPAPKEVADAILQSLNPGPRQFMFWLA